jgi:two-component system chemotaxis response regulator CheB
VIRVLVVDDSAVVTEIVRSVLEQDPTLRVVAVAKNGVEAVALARTLKPDLVIMDIRMPVMDGIEATQAIMEDTPVPILILAASVADDTNLAFRAIQAGAVDVVEKPVAPMIDAYEGLELVQRARLVASVPTIRRLRRKPNVASGSGAHSRGVVGLVASTGGPPALAAVLAGLPKDFHCPVLVVQHIAHGFLQGLVDWLSQQISLRVRIAERGDTAQPGVVYFAPEDAHLVIGPELNLRILKDPPVDGHRPSGTVLLQSMAESCASQALGIVLTGMGRDGAAGLLELRNRGGRTLCQDEATSLIYGMPKVAMELAAAERAVPLESIAHEIVATLRRVQPAP